MDLHKYREKGGFFRFYLLVIVGLAVALFVGYQLNQYQQQVLLEETQSLNNSMQNLRVENEQLQSELNQLQIEFDLLSASYQQILDNNKQAIAREQELKKQISFYQRVVAPELSKDGFAVERLEVKPTASENNYQLSLVMLQNEDVKAVIKGELAIHLHGSLDGKPASYLLHQLQGEPKTSLKFSFKYFQVIDANLTLPANFIPERFEISTDIYKYKRKRGAYNKVVNWQDAYSQ